MHITLLFVREGTMKLRFYFDYSDYRSYLMLPTISFLETLPVQIQWIVVDAFSLRALSGIRVPDTPPERAWLRQEAMRFAASRKLSLVWRNDPVHNGHALRAGVWLMNHEPGIFIEFSRRIMHTLWADGLQPDVALIRDTINDLLHSDDAVETIFSDATSKDNFVYQDMYLQQALSDGVFDVATLVCNTSVFCRYDQENIIYREILSNLLHALPSDKLHAFSLDLLMSLSEASRDAHISALMSDDAPQLAVAREFPQHPIRLHPHTTAPQAIWPLPQTALKNDLVVKSVEIDEMSADPLASVLSQVPDHALALVHGDIEFTSQNAILKTLRSLSQTRHLIARIHDGSRYRMMYARTGTKDAQLLIADADNLLVTFSIRSWKCVLCATEAALDIHMARRAAYQGAHLIIRHVPESDAPASEGWGCLAHAWIAELAQDGAQFVDAFGHRNAKPNSEIRLNANYRLSAIPVWEPPPPRTLLLCDHALSIGPLSAGADLELSCRMQNLEVATAFQKSEISISRFSERLRIGENLIQLIPLSGEQICIPELIAHKLLQTLNRAHAQSIPILVNYWTDLEFDMLETLRPLHALVVETWHIPLIIVVLSQVVEVWQSNAQGTVYRIEKEEDAFTIDLDESIRADQCFPDFLARHGITSDQFLERIHETDDTDHTN